MAVIDNNGEVIARGSAEWWERWFENIGDPLARGEMPDEQFVVRAPRYVRDEEVQEDGDS